MANRYIDLQLLEYHQLDTADFISNGAATLADTVPTTTPNEVGHYLRQFNPVGPETSACSRTARRRAVATRTSTRGRCPARSARGRNTSRYPHVEAADYSK